jgi:hypothetical protein
MHTRYITMHCMRSSVDSRGDCDCRQLTRGEFVEIILAVRRATSREASHNRGATHEQVATHAIYMVISECNFMVISVNAHASLSTWHALYGYLSRWLLSPVCRHARAGCAGDVVPGRLLPVRLAGAASERFQTPLLNVLQYPTLR